MADNNEDELVDYDEEEVRFEGKRAKQSETGANAFFWNPWPKQEIS